jgi:hypothetical protein
VTTFSDNCQALRAAITGSTVSPPIFEVMTILGREECLMRIADQLLRPYADEIKRVYAGEIEQLRGR